MLKYHLLALLIGIIIDLIVGDPHNLWHPVRSIGWLIHKLDLLFEGERRKIKGYLLVIIVLMATFITTFIVFYIPMKINPWLGVIVESIISFYCLATKSLIKESKAVIDAYNEDGIDKARFALSMIVGRDTEKLNINEILKATVETIAENASDGVFAPLFYLVILGPVGGMCYKAINTMDSMIGYKNDKYIDLGRAAARLDDFANFLPSRLTAILTVITAFIFNKKYDYKASLRVFKRDRFNSTSPNSAQSESAFAGALGIQLGGGASYFGVFHKKPFIGDATKEIEIEDVTRAQGLLFRMMLICMAVISIAIVLVGGIEFVSSI